MMTIQWRMKSRKHWTITSHFTLPADADNSGDHGNTLRKISADIGRRNDGEDLDGNPEQHGEHAGDRALHGGDHPVGSGPGIGVICSLHIIRNKNREIEDLKQMNARLMMSDPQLGRDLERKTQELELVRLTRALRMERLELEKLRSANTSLRLELQTKYKRRFTNISQLRRRPQLVPSPGWKRLLALLLLHI